MKLGGLILGGINIQYFSFYGHKQNQTPKTIEFKHLIFNRFVSLSLNLTKSVAADGLFSETAVLLMLTTHF